MIMSPFYFFFFFTLDSGLVMMECSFTIMDEHIVVSKPTYIHTLVKNRSCQSCLMSSLQL